MPAEFVINGTDAIDIQGWTAGTKTLQEIAARNAGDWLEVREQRDREAMDAYARASKHQAYVKSLGQDISFERALDVIGVGTSKNASPLSEQTITTQ